MRGHIAKPATPCELYWRRHYPHDVVGGRDRASFLVREAIETSMPEKLSYGVSQASGRAV
jgi:hypothetical protein